MVRQYAAGVREPRPPSRALDQAVGEGRLERAQMRRGGGLAHQARLSRAGDGAESVHFEQEAEAQGVDHTLHMRRGRDAAPTTPPPSARGVALPGRMRITPHLGKA